MNWFSRLFGLTRKEPTCFDIVADYGAVIENAQRSVSALMDVNELPFEKARIKAAILETALHLRDDPAQIEMLGMGFYMLGSFQTISTSLSRLPDPETLKSLSKEDFLRHVKATGESFGAEKSAQENAMAEKAELLAEWENFLQMLGNSNA